MFPPCASPLSSQAGWEAGLATVWVIWIQRALPVWAAELGCSQTQGPPDPPSWLFPKEARPGSEPFQCLGAPFLPLALRLKEEEKVRMG